MSKQIYPNTGFLHQDKHFPNIWRGHYNDTDANKPKDKCLVVALDTLSATLIFLDSQNALTHEPEIVVQEQDIPLKNGEIIDEKVSAKQFHSAVYRSKTYGFRIDRSPNDKLYMQMLPNKCNYSDKELLEAFNRAEMILRAPI